MTAQAQPTSRNPALVAKKLRTRLRRGKGITWKEQQWLDKYDATTRPRRGRKPYDATSEASAAPSAAATASDPVEDPLPREPDAGPVPPPIEIPPEEPQPAPDGEPTKPDGPPRLPVDVVVEATAAGLMMADIYKAAMTDLSDDLVALGGRPVSPVLIAAGARSFCYLMDKYVIPWIGEDMLHVGNSLTPPVLVIVEKRRLDKARAPRPRPPAPAPQQQPTPPQQPPAAATETNSAPVEISRRNTGGGVESALGL